MIVVYILLALLIIWAIKIILIAIIFRNEIAAARAKDPAAKMASK